MNHRSLSLLLLVAACTPPEPPPRVSRPAKTSPSPTPPVTIVTTPRPVGRAAPPRKAPTPPRPRAKPTEQIITVVERAPQIDIASTKRGTKFDKEYMTQVPQRGRDFEALIENTPGASADDHGVSLGGAQSVENHYEIGGAQASLLPGFRVAADAVGSFGEGVVEGIITRSHGNNPTTSVDLQATSTLSLAPDVASYALARMHLDRRAIPDPAGVRVEDFVNVLDYGYEVPANDDFTVRSELYQSK